MDWGGVIAGALGGVGQQGVSIADETIKQNQKLDIMREEEAAKARGLALAEKFRREGVVWETTGEGGDAKRKGSGMDIEAKATADAAVAPIVAKGRVAGEVAQLRAEKEGGVAQLRGQAKADEIVASMTPQALAALTSESVAKSAGQIEVTKEHNKGSLAVAGVQQQTERMKLSAPKIGSDAEGRIYTEFWDPKTNKVSTAWLVGPDGKPMVGPKDLDERTKLMAQSILAGAKDGGPDAAKAAGDAVYRLLTQGKEGQGNPADPLGLRPTGQGSRPNQPAAPGKEPAAPGPAPAAPAAQPKQDSWADTKASLQPQVDAYNTARQQLRLATQSQDPNTVRQYAQRVQEAANELRSEAEKRLGNQAPGFLSGIIQ